MGPGLTTPLHLKDCQLEKRRGFNKSLTRCSDIISTSVTCPQLMNQANSSQGTRVPPVLIYLQHTDLQAQRSTSGSFASTEQRRRTRQVETRPAQLLQVIGWKKGRGRLGRVVHVVILQQLQHKQKVPHTEHQQRHTAKLRQRRQNWESDGSRRSSWCCSFLTLLNTMAVLYRMLLFGSTSKPPDMLRSKNWVQFT